jgi:hypothetical protein
MASMGTSRLQFSIRNMLTAMVIFSVVAALIARFGGDGVVLVLAGSALSVAIIGANRRKISLILGGLFCFILVGLSGSGTMVWDGHKTVPLRFIIVDAASQQPINGVAVRLRENDLLEWAGRAPFGESPNSATTPALHQLFTEPYKVPPGEPGVSATTGPNGSAVLLWEFWTSGREGFLEHSGQVVIGERLWIQASAPGYATKLVSLAALTGRSRDIADPIPPPMQILLVPEKPK